MKLSVAFVAAIASALVVNASNAHDASLSARHARLARREHVAAPRSLTKRCKNRSSSNTTVSSLTSESSTAEATTSVKTSTSTKKAKTTTQAPAPEPTTSSAKAAATKAPTNEAVVSSAGLLNVVSSCGAIGAVKEVSATAGPNGNIDWLNCGINDGGWTPPYVTVSDIITQDLSTAVQSSSSPFKACSSYISLFEQYGSEFGIPPIMLASFAMQESSCNPNTVGGAGEQGLMQLTKDKCGAAPGGNCKDPDYNIKTGAKFFSDTLSGNNGDLLKSIGQYNGWFTKMTYGEATAAASTSCCRCQQNLDYLHQFLNGWCQNIDAYTASPLLGKYFNLNVC